MKTVSKEEFFRQLYARSEDIMPSIVTPFPYTSEWRNQSTRTLFGKTVESVVRGQIQKEYQLAQ